MTIKIPVKNHSREKKIIVRRADIPFLLPPNDPNYRPAIRLKARRFDLEKFKLKYKHKKVLTNINVFATMKTVIKLINRKGDKMATDNKQKPPTKGFVPQRASQKAGFNIKQWVWLFNPIMVIIAGFILTRESGNIAVYVLGLYLLAFTGFGVGRRTQSRRR